MAKLVKVYYILAVGSGFKPHPDYYNNYAKTSLIIIFRINLI